VSVTHDEDTPSAPGVERYPATEVIGIGSVPGVSSRWIKGPPPQGSWTDPYFRELQLEGAGWTDAKPFNEYLIVVEGMLLVELGGEAVSLSAGDTVLFEAGYVRRYWSHYVGLVGRQAPNDSSRRVLGRHRFHRCLFGIVAPHLRCHRRRMQRVGRRSPLVPVV
jgi:hypothetical protein